MVVSIPEPVRIVLEIDGQQDTISGRVTVEGAPASGFFGWLELMDQLERATNRRGEESCAEFPARAEV